MKDREINLIDLMVEILLKWRVIIALMLMGGILMGCLSYVRSYRTAQSQKAQAAALEQQMQQAESEEQVELEYLQSGLTNMQIHNVNAAVSYECLLKTEEAYLQESIKMQIDPLNVPRALLTFQVVAEDVETAQRIERVYEDMVVGGLSAWLADEVQEELSGEALSELVSLEEDSLVLQEESDTFRIAICHISEEQCLQLVERVDEYFQEKQSQLTREMGEHQIHMVNQEFAFLIDTALLERQQAIQNSMLTWSANAAKLKDAFSAEERQYYNYLTSDNHQEDSDGELDLSADKLQDVSSITVIKPSVNMKYVLIGMIFFAFIYVFFVFLKYILSVRVRATDDVAAIYGVPELGVIPVERESKKIFAFLDDWFLKLRCWNKRRFAVDEAIGLAAVAVKMAVKKEDLNEICCMGCNLKANAVKTANAIQNILKDTGISMKILNNVLYDQEAMEQLLSVKGAFLLERAEETLYDEINREIELLRRQGIKVLGIVVVE